MAERKVYGPIFQFECEVCNCMGDCWDTEAEAVADMEAHDCFACVPTWVRDEIERLRAALALAVEELFTHRQYEAWTHEMLFNQFLEEARRG